MASMKTKYDYKIRKGSYQDINPYMIETGYELAKIRRTLAKRANQRLVRLERATSFVTGESYASYGAASYAYDYLEKIGKKRFNENLSYTDNFTTLRREILILQKFLNAPSSTVEGQRKIEEYRIKTFEKKKIKFASNKEFYDFLNSADYGDITKQFDSDKIVEYYDLARKSMSDKEVKDILSKAVEDMRNKENYSLKDLQKALKII